MDRAAAEDLAGIAGIDIPQYAQSMFEAGSDLSSRSTQEIFYQDYKTFSASDVSFGVGQVTSVSAAGLRQLIPSLQKLMDETYAQNPSTMLFFLLTNIIEENSIVLCSGHKAQELLKPRSVSLTGGTAFHFKDELSGACEPENIPLVATEYNFEPESRQWEYLTVDGIWKDAGCNAAVFEMTPPFHGWEGRDVLTLRYTATYRNEKISATHTFFKLYDGSPSYTVYVESENGTTFRNGIRLDGTPCQGVQGR